MVNRKDDDYVWEGRNALLTRQINRIITISLSAGFDCGYIYAKHEATQTLVEADGRAKAKLVQLIFSAARGDIENILEGKPVSLGGDPFASNETNHVRIYNDMA